MVRNVKQRLLFIKPCNNITIQIIFCIFRIFRSYLNLHAFKTPIIYTRSYFFYTMDIFEPNTLPVVVSDKSIDKFSASLYSLYLSG